MDTLDKELDEEVEAAADEALDIWKVRDENRENRAKNRKDVAGSREDDDR